jgi:hypothetical protein
MEDIRFSQERDEICLQITGRPVDQGVWDRIVHCWPVEPTNACRVCRKQLLKHRSALVFLSLQYQLVARLDTASNYGNYMKLV